LQFSNSLRSVRHATFQRDRRTAPPARLTDQERASGMHGYIEAPDAERATRKANEEFDIEDPHTQRRRIAAQLRH